MSLFGWSMSAQYIACACCARRDDVVVVQRQAGASVQAHELEASHVAVPCARIGWSLRRSQSSCSPQRLLHLYCTLPEQRSAPRNPEPSYLIHLLFHHTLPAWLQLSFELHASAIHTEPCPTHLGLLSTQRCAPYRWSRIPSKCPGALSYDILCLKSPRQDSQARQ